MALHINQYVRLVWIKFIMGLNNGVHNIPPSPLSYLYGSSMFCNEPQYIYKQNKVGLNVNDTGLRLIPITIPPFYSLESGICLLVISAALALNAVLYSLIVAWM